MDSRKAGATGSGIGISGCTFIVFLVLKLCGVIDWSWWWVTAPLWGPSALVIAGFVGYIIITLIIDLIRFCIKKTRGGKRGGN